MRAMDESPVPDYTEFLDRAKALELLTTSGATAIGLLLETARGCWCGAKHHCTFCGLNGQAMMFRSKSSDRVLGEVAERARPHGTSHFEVVDNIIDHGYFKMLLPSCEDRPATSRHGAPHRVRLRGDRLSPIASGNGSRYHGSWSGCS
jgi:hypothetical protein